MTYATNEFNETRKLFIESIGYEQPLTYDLWMDIPADLKSAALFVEFYDQITLAWYKTKSFYTEDADGVSTMMQYLEKNVPVIEQDRERFSPAYIYRVAYNCLYCICHDIKRDRERYENETSNVVQSDGEELDLFDTVQEDSDFLQMILKDNFWEECYKLGPKVEKVINYLMNGTKLTKNTSKKPNEPEYLKDVEVSKDELATIVDMLRSTLVRYQNKGMEVL